MAMVEAWRIVKERHVATAFSGEGAARTGGRWNSRGVTVVYASATRALAALECLVHLNPPVHFRFAAIGLRFDEALMETMPASALPGEWREQPPPPSTRALGDAWFRERRSAVLALPSAIVAGETNYLLNPGHPDFGRIARGHPEAFTFDPRLLR